MIMEFPVERKEFMSLRKQLNKTQNQMAQLLGTSVKAIHSYEQGWRRIPVHAERHLLYLVSRLREKAKRQRPCWDIKKCPPDRKQECPAWEFQSGTLCWFINGTMCEGVVQENWNEKMKLCRACGVFTSLFETPSGDKG